MLWVHQNSAVMCQQKFSWDRVGFPGTRMLCCDMMPSRVTPLLPFLAQLYRLVWPAGECR